MAIGNPITLTSNVASKTISVIATAGQTLFTVTGGYRINQLAVFRNGVRLLDSRDYEARNGSTVTLLSAATVGDALEFQVFDDFRVADAIVSAESEQTISGNLTVSGILTATDLRGSDVTFRHVKATGISTISDTTQSTSTTTGAFIVSGGVGIAKSLFVGGNVSIAGSISYEDVTNVDSVGIITARSHVSIADSILHTGDTDTSIRFPAADTFTVETGGSEALRVDSSQRLLVNTDSAMETFGSAALQVATAAGGTLVLGRDDTSVSVDNGLGAIYFDTKAGGSFAESAVIAAEADAAQGSGDYPSRLVFKTTADGAGSVTERLRITSGGRIGIGTNNPGTSLEVFTDNDTDINGDSGTNNTNSILRLFNKNGSDGTGVNNYTGIRFDVANGATSSAYLNYVRTGDNQGAFLFKARNAASSYPELLRITSSGRLLIATSASQGKWNNSSGDDHIVQIESTSAFSQSWISHSTSSTAGVQLDIGRSRGSSDGDTTVVNNGDLLGHLCFQGADGSQFVRGARISATVNGTPGADDMPTDLVFETNSGTTNSSERLRIDSSGRVLINKTTNRDKYFNGTYSGQLQVEGTSDATRLTQFVHNANSASQPILILGKSRGTSVGSYTVVQDGDFLGTLSFQGADGDEMVDGARIDAVVNGTVANDSMPTDIVFKTNQANERVRFTNTGRIGIGSDDPQAFLVVQGNSNDSTLPSIRLQDGTDARQVQITNTSGDFLVKTCGSDNNTHGSIKIFESGIIALSNGGASGSNVERLRIDTVGTFHFKNGAMVENGIVDTTARNGTQAVNLDNGMVHYFQSSSTGTWKPNFRVNSTNTLNDAMGTGDVVSPTMIVNKSNTAHYADTIQVDGSDVTPEWLGGAPTDGGGNNTFDVYSYTILKTGNAAFKCFASVSNYT